MFVCKACHEKDIKVTKCGESYKEHSVEVWGECDICNQTDGGTIWCQEYGRCPGIPYIGEL